MSQYGEQAIQRITIDKPDATGEVAAGIFVTWAGGLPAAGAACAGVNWSKAEANDDAMTVSTAGVVHATCGDDVPVNNLAVGDRVKVDALGKVIKAGDNEHAVARALEAATEDDATIAVWLLPN